MLLLLLVHYFDHGVTCKSCWAVCMHPHQYQCSHAAIGLHVVYCHAMCTSFVAFLFGAVWWPMEEARRVGGAPPEAGGVVLGGCVHTCGPPSVWWHGWLGPHCRNVSAFLISWLFNLSYLLVYHISFSFDTLQSGWWSQLWLIRYPGLKAWVYLIICTITQASLAIWVAYLYFILFLTEPSTLCALLFLRPWQRQNIVVISSADNDADDVISVLLVTVGMEMEPCVWQ